MTKRGGGFQACAARGPAAQRRHVGLDPGFIDEDQTSSVDAGLVFQPLIASAGDIGTALLAGDQRLFLCVSPWARTNVQTAQ